MIVRATDTGWDIILQRSHGLLAGQIAAAIAPMKSQPYWLETLLAIIEHDDYKEDFGGHRYLTEAGAPKDFTLFQMDDASRFHEAVRRVENQTLRHRWIGLLQSLHVEELYAGEEVSQELQAFLESEAKRRSGVLKDLQSTPEELQSAYQWLGWADRCSLILCRGDVPAMGRHLEIVTTNDGTRYELSEREDDSIDISPWPFLTERFEVTVEVHQLTRVSFRSDEDLYQAIKEATTINKRWTLTADQA